MTSIGYQAFYKCSGLTSITIPNSVTSIGASAFYNCSGLICVTIPESVTSIYESAFSGCSGLTSVTIPNGVTSIGVSAFYNCSGLTSISIPNSVTSIGGYAFFGCVALSSISIPNSVTSIGSYAFYNCSGLTKVVVNDIAAWCGITFGNSSSLPSAYHLYSDKNTEITNLIIPEGVKSVGSYAFSGCSGLTSITIPNSVKSIGSSAFEHCSGLTKVVVNDIAAWCGITFGNSSSLPSAYHLYSDKNTEITNLIIPEGVKSVGSYAFSGCSGLTSITIPNSVTSIGWSAFSGCTGLTSITIPNSVTSIGERAFSGCSGLTSITIPENVTSIGEAAFFRCSGLTSITIPKSVTSIGGSAFQECKSLTSISIPNGVTSISQYTFSCCSGLTSITIPESVTSIGYQAFDGCIGLTSITIPEGVTSIGNYAFRNCYGLTSITIPNSVLSIYSYAFNGCSGLKRVTVMHKVPLTISSGVFSSVGNTILCVPSGCKAAYEAADYWKNFKEIVEVEEETIAVTGIELSETNITFNKLGKTKTLSVTILPSIATNKSVNWSSDNTTVCTVSAAGVVTAVGSGTATITATTVDGGKTATCAVMVHASLTLGASGIQTFSCDDPTDFTNVNGLKAFIASGFSPSTGELTMTRVMKVPAGEGLIVKGEAGSYEVPFAETDNYYANLLKGVTTTTDINPTEGDYTNYILANDAHQGIGFYTLSNAGTIAAGKAYLQLPTMVNSTRRVKMVFDDEEVTSISEEFFAEQSGKAERRVKNEKSAAAVYNLQGQRVKSPSKGVYVKGGKKVLVK